MRFQCWSCGETRALDDEGLDKCCLTTLLEMGTAINTALLRYVPTVLDDLVAQRDEVGDRIANWAAVSSDPAARRAAVAWRNWRASR